MIGTWTTRKSATRPNASQNCGSLKRVGVVLEADEDVAADELLAEQAEVDRVADRREEDEREDDQERADEGPALRVLGANLARLGAGNGLAHAACRRSSFVTRASERRDVYVNIGRRRTVAC